MLTVPFQLSSQGPSVPDMFSLSRNSHLCFLFLLCYFLIINVYNVKFTILAILCVVFCFRTGDCS